MLSPFIAATAVPVSSLASQATRGIVQRTLGRQHGPITRFMSPGDLGDALKPFVFLDLFEVDPSKGVGFAPHPHSGIATLTTILEGAMSYADSTSKSGQLSAGAIEWMQAGGGVWHGGDAIQGSPIRGYQLWLALPEALELSPAESLYLDRGQIQGSGPWRVILGNYGGKTSAIPLPAPLTYLHVRLKDGDRWTYHPGADHDVAWLTLNCGRLHVSGLVLERELAVFAEGHGIVEVVAEGDVELVIGSAVKHPHPLVTGHYSVHTSSSALTQGERTIAQMEHTPAVIALRRTS